MLTDQQNYIITRPDTRHKMRLVCVLFTFENNTGHTDRRTDGPTDRRTDGPTDTTSYRDATAHLKMCEGGCGGKNLNQYGTWQLWRWATHWDAQHVAIGAVENNNRQKKTRTAGFKRCDYLVVTYCSFPFIFVFDGRTDRLTDILMSFLNCPWLSLGPCQISSSSERTFFVVRK